MMCPNLDFFPDAARARILDRRMRDHLANSLSYLHGVLGNDIESTGILASHAVAMREGGIYPPTTFGLYYELVLHLLDGDSDALLPLLGELAAERPLSDPATQVIPLSAIAPPANQSRYQRLMDTDPAMPFDIVSPPAEHLATASSLVHTAITRLRRCLPELGGEMETLVREIVLVEGGVDTRYDFAGGSCYMLWGALFLNAGAHEHELAMMEALVHESAHCLLFGFTIDEPLTETPDNQRFDSPLRRDPRPMDGVYHATFVLARMHWALSSLLDSGLLSEDECRWVQAAVETNCRHFQAGYATVARHAKLTDTGRCLMQNAVDYMRPFMRKMHLE